MLLETRQGFRKVFIGEAFVLLVEGVRLLAQSPIRDKTSTTEGTSEDMLLLTRWVDAILVGSFLFHVYFVAYYGVNVKHIPPAGGAASIPMAKARGLMPRIDKGH